MSAQQTHFAGGIYPRAYHRESDPQALITFMEGVGFGQLVCAQNQGLHATGIPFLVGGTAEGIYLEGHLHRSNPQVKALPVEGLFIVQGPHAYIRPAWYETKKRDGKAVPTWNYLIVQARGRVEVLDDKDWVLGHLHALSAANEAAWDDPWDPDMTPPGYMEMLLGAIVGIRMTVSVMDGLWKLSANQPRENRLGVIRGLRESGGLGPLGVAEAMEARERRASDEALTPI
jgi:transcriptional regulator